MIALMPFRSYNSPRHCRGSEEPRKLYYILLFAANTHRVPNIPNMATIVPYGTSGTRIVGITSIESALTIAMPAVCSIQKN